MMLPRPRLTKDQWEKFLKDPEVVTLEILFVALTLCNVFVVYRILFNVCPFPVVVTWFQLLMGFFFAYILGETSCEFPRCAFFPPLTLDIKLYEGLFVPTLVYIGMVTMANVLLRATPSVGLFPVVVSLAVALHHVSRFLGCGQIYLPVRWVSLGVMFLGFFIAIFDPSTMGTAVFPLAVLYALFSSTFRAWCLEKAMHVCDGRGNTLHNHQVIMGLVVLPFVIALSGEWRVFSWMPNNFSKLFTWQVWGCLVTAGAIPFVKNIVANRMIRRTGQAPWRILEGVSIFLVFVIGYFGFAHASFIGTVAFLLVLSGRILGMMDALAKDPAERRRALNTSGHAMMDEPQHGSAPPSSVGGRHKMSYNESSSGSPQPYPQYNQNYDPTGIADGFDRADDTQQRMSPSVGSRQLSGGRGGYGTPSQNGQYDMELQQGSKMEMQNAGSHFATKPLLSTADNPTCSSTLEQDSSAHRTAVELAAVV